MTKKEGEIELCHLFVHFPYCLNGCVRAGLDWPDQARLGLNQDPGLPFKPSGWVLGPKHLLHLVLFSKVR